jgi:hypothetical protein
MRVVLVSAFAALAATLLLALPAGAASPATNPIANPSFETGDFTGWTVSPATGGSANIVAGGVDGAFHAQLVPGTVNQYTTVSQIIPRLGGGGTLNKLMGWAAFDAVDSCSFTDNAQVYVDRIVAGFIASSTLVFSADTCGGDTGWVQWSYTIPGQGAYRIRAQVANGGDSIIPSLLYIDAHTYGAITKVTP